MTICRMNFKYFLRKIAKFFLTKYFGGGILYVYKYIYYLLFCAEPFWRGKSKNKECFV